MYVCGCKAPRTNICKGKHSPHALHADELGSKAVVQAPSGDFCVFPFYNTSRREEFSALEVQQGSSIFTIWWGDVFLKFDVMSSLLLLRVCVFHCYPSLTCFWVPSDQVYLFLTTLFPAFKSEKSMTNPCLHPTLSSNTLGAARQRTSLSLLYSILRYGAVQQYCRCCFGRRLARFVLNGSSFSWYRLGEGAQKTKPDTFHQFSEPGPSGQGGRVVTHKDACCNTIGVCSAL